MILMFSKFFRWVGGMRGSFLLLLVCCIFLAGGQNAMAANDTVPGAWEALPQNLGIALTVDYSGDDNTDNQLQVEWDLDGGLWDNSVTLDHQLSPYQYSIDGLSNGLAYQVRVTLLDADGSGPAMEITGLVPRNRLLHSSLATGSSKWGAGGWGIDSGKYGEFSCGTCHVKRSPNIKRVKANLTAASDQFPIQIGGQQVAFVDARSGSSSFGDDSRIPATSSTNICEGCHSQTRYHRYDTSGQDPGDLSHYNKGDCIGCHQHSEAFQPSCGGCHATPPVWGSHSAHTEGAAMMSSLECQLCHQGAPHLNNDSEVLFEVGDTRLSGAVYNDGEPTSRYTEGGGYVDSPVYVSCETLYCHSNAAPFDGVNSYKTPSWGGGAQDCVSCHAESGATTTLSGRHGKHTDAASYGFVCEKCHAATVTGSDVVSDASLHVDGSKDVVFASYNGVTGSYNSAKGCDATYCHSDGRGGNGNVPVAWSDTTSLDCTGCHNGRIGDGSMMMSNAHDRLATDEWIRQYPCEYCHAATVDNLGNLLNGLAHVNGEVDVVFKSTWNIDERPPASYNAATQSCDNLYCHSDGTVNPPQVREYPWTLEQHAECDSCHGHAGDCIGCHEEQGYTGWPVGDEWKKATPMYVNGGAGTERANSHARHLALDYACQNCHSITVPGSCVTELCHTGGEPTGQMTETEVGHVNAENHIKNKWPDVILKDGGIWDPATNEKTCSGSACHVGDKPPQWGGSRDDEALWCLKCHRSSEADVTNYVADDKIQGRINESEWFTTGHGRPAIDGPYPKSGNPAANFPGNACWYCHDKNSMHKDTTNPLRLMRHPQFEARFDKECVYCHMERTEDECLSCHDSDEALAPQLAVITGTNPEDGELYADDHAPYVGGATACMTAGCHLPQDADSCGSCHESAGHPSGARQLSDSTTRVGMVAEPYAVSHLEFASGGSYDTVSCMATPAQWPPTGCHMDDVHIHNTGTGIWTPVQKADMKNQYVMMGVCLQCHDNDDNGRCATCHSAYADDPETPQDEWNVESNPYRLGYDPGPGFITGSSKASSTHFGFKHFEDYQSEGTWRGGKFCWDCHDPHGDTNIYMIQDQVATETDGTFGIPITRAEVVFIDKSETAGKGRDYAVDDGDIKGICNVCHTNTAHYRWDTGDSHQSERLCTECHEHGFGDSHASDQSCDECHKDKPVSTHTGFSQPRDCTKCHTGWILNRMNIMLQFNSPSHHVQGVDVTNRHCYECHWEATKEGLINDEYHAGYNFKTHSGVADAKNDLVVRVSAERPTEYELSVTAVIFNATTIGTPDERQNVANVTKHCLGCHSDQANDEDVFGDCKTPRQYAWDRTSIEARYSQLEPEDKTAFGKYPGYPNAAQKIQDKAYSAHGNAAVNQEGWDPVTGRDGVLPDTSGAVNVQCYDCHSSHGSNTLGVTSSYLTFNGSNNGGNLKEAQPGLGGYTFFYNAKAISSATNTMGAGAAQCFDCHETANADNGTPGDPSDDLPWGYFSTFGATAPIRGYYDTPRFDGQGNGVKERFPYRAGKTGISGHYHTDSTALLTPAKREINSLCCGCHDPHGVSPSLGDNQKYAVPLLKGTWLTSPYKEDSPQTNVKTRAQQPNITSSNVQIDRKTFNDLTGRTRITEDDTQFAGLCLRCHPKESLTDGSNKNYPFNSAEPWEGIDRVHESVKGWGSNAEHSFSCSKCHQPHSSGLKRLMRTNCLDWNHRGNLESGGVVPGWHNDTEHYPRLRNRYQPCHQSAGAAGGTESSGNFLNQQWNDVTPWGGE